LVLVLTLMMAFPVMAADKVLMMATTTSTDNTGLLDYLAPHFTKATGIDLKWTSVGTGKALKMGENCDVDVLLVHAPPAEKAYVEKGFGVNRREIMYNDFVIIGPDTRSGRHQRQKGCRCIGCRPCQRRCVCQPW
jgi:tungstate transport system substrate-binding protein